MLVDNITAVYVFRQVLLLIEHLRTSMKEIITDIDWMEGLTKTFAKDKVLYNF